jgi:hypothetical protein
MEGGSRMIDTDKYEGHTPVRKEWPSWCEDWLFYVYSKKTEDGSHTPTWNQDNALACDAPLLLAEVKRLREELRVTQSNFRMVRNALANQYPELEEAIWKVIE